MAAQIPNQNVTPLNPPTPVGGTPPNQVPQTAVPQAGGQPMSPPPQPTPQPQQTTSTVLDDANGNKTLVSVLLAQGTLTPDKAKELSLKAIQTGEKQEDVIESSGLVNEEALAKAKATLYNVPFVDVSAVPVNPEAIALLPRDVANKFQVFPLEIDKKDKTLSLAMSDPLDLTAIEFSEKKTGMRIMPKAGVPSEIAAAIAQNYSTTLSKEVTEALKEVPGTEETQRSVASIANQKTGVIRQERISEIVNYILDFAVRGRASDIHIEPMENETRVRYRIDGVLQEKLTIPRNLHDALLSRIKILSGMKIDEKRIPQDGRFNFKAGNEEVDLRVSTVPTSWGEKVVLRLLKKSGGIPDLPDLGLRGIALKHLQEAIARPHGIITICGPTGSGKTTTLYSIIQRINTPKVNIMTLEDPIEYKIPGVTQVQVNRDVDLTFASGLRAFLRQDPNIILVGEIRDEETASLAVQASLTGHLVFSTLHTNDSAGALPRLLDMGVEPFLLSSSMTAILAQRVLRKIDPETKEAYTPDPKVVEDIKKVLGPLYPKDLGQVKLYHGKPTPDNNNSGYKGRIGIFEVMPVSPKISRLIVEKATSSEIEKVAFEEGMITMKQDGYLKALEGITTIEEVIRVAQD